MARVLARGSAGLPCVHVCMWELGSRMGYRASKKGIWKMGCLEERACWVAFFLACLGRGARGCLFLREPISYFQYSSARIGLRNGMAVV